MPVGRWGHLRQAAARVLFASGPSFKQLTAVSTAGEPRGVARGTKKCAAHPIINDLLKTYFTTRARESRYPANYGAEYRRSNDGGAIETIRANFFALRPCPMPAVGAGRRRWSRKCAPRNMLGWFGGMDQRLVREIGPAAVDCATERAPAIVFVIGGRARARAEVAVAHALHNPALAHPALAHPTGAPGRRRMARRFSTFARRAASSRLRR